MKIYISTINLYSTLFISIDNYNQENPIFKDGFAGDHQFFKGCLAVIKLIFMFFLPTVLFLILLLETSFLKDIPKITKFILLLSFLDSLLLLKRTMIKSFLLSSPLLNIGDISLRALPFLLLSFQIIETYFIRKKNEKMIQRLVCWELFLFEFNFKIVYCSGFANGNLDVLSRPPDYALSNNDFSSCDTPFTCSST